MHSVKMRPVDTHVAWSVCLFVTTVSPTKTDERIQMPLECKLTGAEGGKVYMGVHIGSTWRIRMFFMSFILNSVCK